jgi:hypothetical protein
MVLVHRDKLSNIVQKFLNLEFDRKRPKSRFEDVARKHKFESKWITQVIGTLHSVFN